MEVILLDMCNYRCAYYGMAMDKLIFRTRNIFKIIDALDEDNIEAL